MQRSKTLLLVAVVLGIGGSTLSPSYEEFCTYPNISDSYFNVSFSDIDVQQTVSGTSIFTFPSVSSQPNCSNNVTAIQYCYRADSPNAMSNNPESVFEFLFITRDGFLFTFNEGFTVCSALSRSTCSCQGPSSKHCDCCDTYEVPPEHQFLIPSTFGVHTTNMKRRLYAFRSLVNDSGIEQFQTTISEGSVNLSAGGQVSIPNVLLLRFLTSREHTLGSSSVLSSQASLSLTITTASSALFLPTPVNSHSPLFSSTRTVSQASLPVMSQASLSVTITTALLASSPYSLPMATSVNSPDSSLSSSAPTMTEASSSSLAISTLGGAVGGAVLAVLLVGVVILVLCVLIVITRRRPRKENVIKEHEGMSLGNATYDGVGVMVSSSGIPYQEYSYVGPEVIATAKETSEENVQYGQSGPSYETPTTAGHSKPAATDPHYEMDERRDEDIYQVPAKDESALYAQLQDIRTHNLSRRLVRLGDMLGSGQFGTVYKGVLDSEGGEVEVAVKTPKEESGEDRVKFLQEAAIMGQFKHHGVVEMYGVVTLGEPILLVLELLSKGDLRGHLLHMKANEGEGVSVDDHTLLSYCRQVASGMTYLSSKAFVHRDLAARNILVSDDEICKIADFGMSRDLIDESYYVSHGGMIPVKWTAPEALHFKKYSTASDVWSYGALMYEIWGLGHKPFATYANNKVIKLVDTGYRLPPPPGCPRALYNIMMSCWHPETSGRPSFQDLTRQLSLPDTKLLKWSEEDKSVHPEAAQLGADLLCGEELYTDLQTKYKNF